MAMHAHGITYLFDSCSFLVGLWFSTEKWHSIEDIIFSIPLIANKDGILMNESKVAIFLLYTADFYMFSVHPRSTNRPTLWWPVVDPVICESCESQTWKHDCCHVR
jgi:hypothetical protein